MKSFITGYQYGERNQFLGEYVFETHTDFEPYLPPKTVLVQPQAIPKGKEAIWNSSFWEIVDKPEHVIKPLPKVVMVTDPIPEIDYISEPPK